VLHSFEINFSEHFSVWNCTSMNYCWIWVSHRGNYEECDAVQIYTDVSDERSSSSTISKIKSRELCFVPSRCWIFCLALSLTLKTEAKYKLFLWNVGELLPYSKTLYPRRQYFFYECKLIIFRSEYFSVIVHSSFHVKSIPFITINFTYIRFCTTFRNQLNLPIKIYFCLI
jgi:hypothetical protein